VSAMLSARSSFCRTGLPVKHPALSRRVPRRRLLPPRADLTPADLSAALQPLMDQQAAMQKQLSSVLAATSRTDARVGHLFEANVRTSVAKELTSEYAEAALVQSLYDVACLLPLGGTPPLDAAKQASRALVDAGVPRKVLLRCERAARLRAEEHGAQAAARCEEAGPWLDADGSVRVTAMESCLSTCGDVALAILARKLRTVVGKSAEEQAALLLDPAGPGVACLLDASLQGTVAAGDDDLPGESFELDARGLTGLEEAGAVFTADVGEIKAGMDYAIAVPQLGRALCALRWMAATCLGCDVQRARLKGRLFVPRSQVKVAAADPQQVQLALSTYGFELFVHAL